jgi:hypothetical protein
MKLTTAQRLVLSYYGDDLPPIISHPPHKPQGTPTKPHRPRRFWDGLKFSARVGYRPPVFGGRT